MAITKDPSKLPQLDVETQLVLAQQSGKLSGPGYDIEALKAAGLVVPDPSAPTGVAPIGTVPTVSGISTPTIRAIPQLDVETQLVLAQQSGKLSGPGYDIEALKAAGLVVPDKESPIGVALPRKTETTAPATTAPATTTRGRQRWFWQSQEVGAAEAPGKADVTIGLTQEELDKVADATARNLCEGTMKAHYTPKLWEVKLYGQDNILVEALTEKSAREKAEGAGYEGIYAVSRVFDWDQRFATGDFATPKPSATVKIKDGKTGETLEFPRDDWNAWPEKYQELVTSEGYDAAMKSFRADHVRLNVNDPWFPREAWDAIKELDERTGSKFAKIGLAYGYEAMAAALDEHREEWLAELKEQAPDLYKLHEQGKYDEFYDALSQRDAACRRPGAAVTRRP